MEITRETVAQVRAELSAAKVAPEGHRDPRRTRRPRRHRDDAQAAAQHLSADRRDAVTTCHRYLTSHLDQLHYDTALAVGWPIATGAVEGACRHLIADRLDITGARCGLDGAEASSNSAH